MEIPQHANSEKIRALDEDALRIMAAITVDVLVYIFQHIERLLFSTRESRTCGIELQNVQHETHAQLRYDATRCTCPQTQPVQFGRSAWVRSMAN